MSIRLPEPPGERWGLAAAAVAGVSWTWARLLRYPAGFFDFLRDDPPLAIAVLAILLALLLGGVVAAALFYAPVVASRRLPETEQYLGRNPGAVAALLALAAAVPRLLLLRELPGAAWTDGVHAIYAAASAGRFLWPWESVPIVPPEIADPGRVLLFGLYVDFARLTLLAAPDRVVACALLSALPAIGLPPLLYLLVRRLAGERAGRLAGLLLAFSCPALVFARWGWVQQMMVLLQLAALERTAAGVLTGRRGALAAGGALAGLSLHTYVGSYPATAALAAALLLLAWRRRSAREPAWFAAGLLPVAGLLALVYAARPEAMGGRPQQFLSCVSLRTLATNAVCELRGLLHHLGVLFFVTDPNPRHGLPEAAPVPLLAAALIPLGASRARRGWSLVLLPLLATVVAGSLVNLCCGDGRVELQPNTFQAGLAWVLALAFAGAGLAALAAGPRWRVIAVYGATLVLGAHEFARFLRWGILDRTPPLLSYRLKAAGEFLDDAGSARACLDPGLIGKEESQLVAGFRVHPRARLAPFRLPCVIASDPVELAGNRRYDWYLTSADRAAGARGVRLGPPGTGAGTVQAIDLAALRRDPR